MSDVTGIGSIFDFGRDVIDKIFPDATQAAEAKAKLLEAQQAGQLAELAASWENAKAQLTVDQSEAGNENLFVSGWRPFIGWVCGVAFAYKFVAAPFLLFVVALLGRQLTLPALEFTDMLPVLFGMLGLGAMRSYDKVQGVSPTKNG
jgi:hypothetical protein